MINEKVVEWENTGLAGTVKSWVTPSKEVEGLSGRESELANLEAENQDLVDDGDYDGSTEQALDELQADFFNAQR